MNLAPSLNSRSARVALLAFGVVTATSFAQLAPAPSAASTPAEEPVKMSEFSVTGSNIKRLDVEKVLPVTILDQAAIDLRDASQAADLLIALPQVTGLPGNETAFAGAGARGDNANISLRGIPSANTL